jgi:hypothetical protein
MPLLEGLTWHQNCCSKLFFYCDTQWVLVWYLPSGYLVPSMYHSNL